eukprot:CAMPEP_0172726002 /NCGR_PEP_ID=MMETSP1074-20121228/89727_1 /TAXON_ID=2916 /ORGANISM="Ceratium fusus, Strain PA161109" /LENGTH=135 /DNA_ID=CAMNT_0013552901 /DNA_START=77 /DNA_END=484 /DNA_ORIENTATION=-
MNAYQLLLLVGVTFFSFRANAAGATSVRATLSLQPSLRAPATSKQNGELCEASFKGKTSEERCNAIVQFVKGGMGSIPDKYWPEDESCEDIIKRLAELKEVQQKCDKSATCWQFLKGVLPTYLNRYERVKAEKKC